MSCSFVGKRRLLQYENETMQLETWSWHITEVPVVWGFTCDFPEKFKQDVRDSFQWWDDMTNIDLFHERKCVKTEDVWPEKQMIVVTWSKKNADGDRVSVRGTAYRDIISIDDRHMRSVKIRFWKHWFIDGKNFRLSVARHEVGHALGLHHIPYKDCLMHRFMNSKGGLKSLCDVEIKEFKRHYGPTAVPVEEPR